MLTSLDHSLYIAEDDLNMPGGIHFPLRMSVIVFSDRSLVLHSPIPIDDALAADIEALGTVTFIIAPNCFHHLYAGAACQRWPDAALYAAQGVQAKQPNLRIDYTLDENVPAAWSNDLSQILVKGLPKLNEAVFFHEASRTLILTDLVFNMLQPKTFASKCLMRMAGTYKKCGQSRLLRFLTKDRAAAARSLQQILDWPFERVIMAHGDILEDDARAKLKDAWRWMLAA